MMEEEDFTMTSRTQMWLIFGMPVLIMFLFGVGIGITEGNWDFLPFITGVGLVSVLLVFGLAWLIMAGKMGSKAKVLQEIARKRGGELRQNLMGEVQLRIRDGEGFITLDYRHYARATPAGRDVSGWTRVSWEGCCPRGAALELDPVLEEMVKKPSYSPELREVLEKFLALRYVMARVGTSPTTTPPMVMFEIPSWVGDREQLETLLDDTREPLRALAHITEIRR